MKVVTLASLFVAIGLAVSGCGNTSGTSSLAGLPKSLRAFIHSTTTGLSGETVREVDVYGPGARAALVKAVSGDIVHEQGNGYYLLVLHGHFVANGPLPPGAKPPTGTVETLVWSPHTGVVDLGITHGVPPAVSKLNRVATLATANVTG